MSRSAFSVLRLAVTMLACGWLIQLLTGCYFDPDSDPTDFPEDSMAFRGISRTARLRIFDASVAETIQADLSGITEGAFTVQFSVHTSQPTFASPRAEITWSVGGNSVERMIDVSDGTSISGVGAAVRVKVYDCNPMTPMAIDTDYSLGVTIGPGTRAANARPPVLAMWRDDPTFGWLHGGAGIGGGGVADLFTTQVPLNSGVNGYLVSLDGIPPLHHASPLIDVWSEQGVNTFRFGAMPVNTGIWVPLHPQATQIDVRTSDAVPASLTFVMFSVDG